LLRLPAVRDNAAMETEPPNAEPPKRTRRWFQFSLRSLLIVVTVAALVCALLSAVVSRLPNELTLKQLRSVKVGMSEDPVLELLGRPDAITPNENGGVDWEHGMLFPDVIEFKDGRVVSAVRF
jgi:hypothetical protein